MPSAFPGKNLTEERRRELRALFPVPEQACPDCGGYHLRACPRVKSQEWEGQGAGTGNRIKVEYWPQGSYDDGETLYPEDVFEEDE